MTHDFILIAFGFDGKGGGKRLRDEEVSEWIRDDRPAWAHLDATRPETREWLHKEISYLDPYVAEALLASETRPRMTQIGDGALLILRGANLNENAAPEDMVSVRLWIDSHRIISVQRRTLTAVKDVEEKLSGGCGPLDTGEFVAMLALRLFERMQPALNQLDDDADRIEERILERADTSLREDIIAIRKKAILFRRYMAPQREAVDELRMADLSWLNEIHRRHLQESYNHVTRYVEDLDAVRERSQIVKDELANMISDKLNRNMYVLSVIASIFLPLGFLTGLLGINVGGLPGANSPYAFWIFCGFLATLIIAQVWIFKKLRWF
ncbi:MAG: zinc transporter ZntB [Rickettsiales bacterium]